MQKRAAGYPADEIPVEEQMEVVDMVWNAPEEDVLAIGKVFDFPGKWILK